MKKKAPLSKRLMFLIGIVLAVIVFWELCARIFLVVDNRSVSYLFYGIVSFPTPWERVADDEGKLLYFRGVPSEDPDNPVNSLGMRGKEFLPVSTEAIRIACLGGSTTYGTDLDHSETYPVLLQQKLNRTYGKGSYEVMNFGQPGMDLHHINALTKDTVLALKPDITLIMSINNNLRAKDYFYVGFKGGLKSNTEELIYRCSACAYLAKKIVGDVNRKKLYERLAKYDWTGFAAALASSDNIWQADYEQRLDSLCAMLLKSNPAMKIVLLEQAINTHDYGPMEVPFDIAKAILREKSRRHQNIYTVDVHSPVVAAAAQGTAVWQRPKWDPLHLVKTGNEIVAAAVAEFIITHRD